MTWKSGHIEEIHAHQVTLREPLGYPLESDLPTTRRVTFYAEIDGRWKLVLDAPADEVETIRLITQLTAERLTSHEVTP